MGRVPGHDDNDLMLSPVEACCGDKELSMDEVWSGGPTAMEHGYGCGVAI